MLNDKRMRELERVGLDLLRSLPGIVPLSSSQTYAVMVAYADACHIYNHGMTESDRGLLISFLIRNRDY